MNIYRVTITGANTNKANRIVRYFSSRGAAQDYIDQRAQTDAPGTIAVLKGLKVRD